MSSDEKTSTVRVAESNRVHKSEALLEGSQTPSTIDSQGTPTPPHPSAAVVDTEDSGVVPDSRKQPILDTIDPPVPVEELRLPLPRSIETSYNNRRKQNMQGYSGDMYPSPEASGLSSSAGPETINGPSPPQFLPARSGGGHRTHRRTHSNEDVPRSPYQHHHSQRYPQVPYSYYPPPSSPQSHKEAYSPQQQYPRHMMMMNQQPPYGMSPPPPHPIANRARTWSDPNAIPEQEPYAMHQPQIPARHAFDEGTSLLPQQQLSAGSESYSRSRRKGRSHRKSHSSSAAMPGSYGAFWNGEQDTAGMPHARHADPSFSPRNEFLSLTASFRKQGEMSPVGSPRQQLRKANSDRCVTWSPTHRARSHSLVSWSPVTPVPASPYEKAFGSEAAYHSAKRKGHESSRKMHMRQQSAQLFVQDVKGVEQPAKCRDVLFLLLFVFHLFAMVYLGDVYGKNALISHEFEGKDSEVTVYYQNLVYIACLSGGFAVVVSASVLAAMTIFARHFLQIALIIIITLSFVWGTIGIGLSPKNVVPITGIIALALSVAYTFIVWDRIPFAASNLLTALTGVRSFPGTIVIAFVFQALVLLWSVYYVVVVAGVYDAIKEGQLELSHRMTVVAYVLLGTSFYWTFQVLSNAVQVATASVIGSWWNSPKGEAVVQRSAFKTIFYSMGSICFGSLFVGPVRILRMFALLFRPNSEETSLMCLGTLVQCIQTCISSCVDSLADRFNPWAFTYIGLYGYGFLDAGLHATELFEKRGWTTIVSDDLVPNVLLMTSLVIGGVTGCFAHTIDQLSNLSVLSLNEPGVVSFWVGSGVGLVLTSVLFGVISSATNAVLVCFASSPLEFEKNHPELSHEMREAWREVWPGALDVTVFDVADIQAGLAIPSYSVNSHLQSPSFDPDLL